MTTQQLLNNAMQKGIAKRSTFDWLILRAKEDHNREVVIESEFGKNIRILLDNLLITNNEGHITVTLARR